MKRHLFFEIVFFVFFIDQLTKWYVRTADLQYKYIHYVTNTGAAFGLFKGANIIFALLIIIVVAIILYCYYYIPSYFKEKWVAWSTALILGGALGNLVDRLFFGHVIDFIDLKYWPVFNVADMSLTIGVLILVYVYWKDDKCEM